jgi:hypothetical protein
MTRNYDDQLATDQMMMNGMTAPSPQMCASQYEPPMLMLVGDARDLILGLPGGGADGPYGMTEPQFEFEDDGEN